MSDFFKAQLRQHIESEKQRIEMNGPDEHIIPSSPRMEHQKSAYCWCRPDQVTTPTNRIFKHYEDSQ